VLSIALLGGTGSSGGGWRTLLRSVRPAEFWQGRLRRKKEEVVKMLARSRRDMGRPGDVAWVRSPRLLTSYHASEKRASYSQT